ncbi:hypothetical protein GDO81_007039 [Engystomops pustulosus]|uniref:Uncharacterized protein n=1 Tax=Engystomops pustulosus TaxID=76066 RepID=A0AAV7D0W9_ENGPU|nr:hypothetical protein GDO81_007039 [Engystomops pustulosus]
MQGSDCRLQEDSPAVTLELKILQHAEPKISLCKTISEEKSKHDRSSGKCSRLCSTASPSRWREYGKEPGTQYLQYQPMFP